jgi:hypothetical protein
MLLRALHEVALNWSGFRLTNVAHARHLLIKWAELLATLDVMTRPQTAAYSKPKWLYAVLKRAGLQDALNLLNTLYVPRPERLQKMRDAIEAIIAAHDVQSLENRFHKLINTSVNDAQSCWLSCRMKRLRS